jgi:hypothetical protein
MRFIELRVAFNAFGLSLNPRALAAHPIFRWMVYFHQLIIHIIMFTICHNFKALIICNYSLVFW